MLIHFIGLLRMNGLLIRRICPGLLQSCLFLQDRLCLCCRSLCGRNLFLCRGLLRVLRLLLRCLGGLLFALADFAEELS